MGTVLVRCPNAECLVTDRVDADAVGRLGHCRHCGEPFVLAPFEPPRPESKETAGTPFRVDTQVTPSDAVTDGPTKVTTTVGRFKLKKRLGKGGFGTVYLAHDPKLRRDVALKIPHLGLLARPGTLDRFLDEARAAARLRHPNVVRVYDVGDDPPYIAYEYVEGRTLRAAALGSLPKPRRGAAVVRDVARAAHHAHLNGLVHRDIKPSNVLLDAHDRTPYLTDFGLATAPEWADDRPRRGLVGTPPFIAPEVLLDPAALSPAADQYALGVTLYTLITGRPPFQGRPKDVVHQTVNAEVPRPSAVWPEVPADLEAVCLKAMAKGPAARYPSCKALADDLDRFLGGEPVLARGGRGRVQPLKAAAVAAAVVAGGLALAVGGGLALRALGLI